MPVAEKLAEEVISLPMHAYLDAPTQDRIIGAVRRALGALMFFLQGLGAGRDRVIQSKHPPR